MNLAGKLAVVYFAARDESGNIRDSTIEDPAAAAAPAILASREIREKLREQLGTLPEEERTLIRMVYFEGATLQEAANHLKISKSWASRLHARTLETLAGRLRQLGASD